MGYRNGYGRQRQLALTSGTITVRRPQTQADAGRSAELLIGVLGGERDVRTISVRDIARYADQRKRGGIRYHTIDKRSKQRVPKLRVTPQCANPQSTVISRLFARCFGGLGPS